MFKRYWIVPCGGAVRIFACIDNPIVINKILDHLRRKRRAQGRRRPQTPRAPPTMLVPNGLTEFD